MTSAASEKLHRLSYNVSTRRLVFELMQAADTGLTYCLTSQRRSLKFLLSFEKISLLGSYFIHMYSLSQKKYQGGDEYALPVSVKIDHSIRSFGRTDQVLHASSSSLCIIHSH